MLVASVVAGSAGGCCVEGCVVDVGACAVEGGGAFALSLLSFLPKNDIGASLLPAGGGVLATGGVAGFCASGLAGGAWGGVFGFCASGDDGGVAAAAGDAVVADFAGAAPPPAAAGMSSIEFSSMCT